MANAMRIEGLEETKAFLNSVAIGIYKETPATLERIGSDGTRFAKARVPVETGALQESIKNVTEKTARGFQEIISAGDPDVARGVGRFSKIEGTDEKASFHLTSEYAWKIDEFGSRIGRGKGFLSIETFNQVIAKTLSTLSGMLERVIRGVLR